MTFTLSSGFIKRAVTIKVSVDLGDIELEISKCRVSDGDVREEASVKDKFGEKEVDPGVALVVPFRLVN